MLLRHANPPPRRIRGFLATPMGREVAVTAGSLTCAAWWGIGGWAAVPLLICLGLLVLAAAAFGVQVGIGLARRSEALDGEAGDSAALELLACLGARP